MIEIWIRAPFVVKLGDLFDPNPTLHNLWPISVREAKARRLFYDELALGLLPIHRIEEDREPKHTSDHQNMRPGLWVSTNK